MNLFSEQAVCFPARIDTKQVNQILQAFDQSFIFSINTVSTPIYIFILHLKLEPSNVYYKGKISGKKVDTFSWGIHSLFLLCFLVSHSSQELSQIPNPIWPHFCLTTSYFIPLLPQRNVGIFPSWACEMVGEWKWHRKGFKASLKQFVVHFAKKYMIYID